MLIYPMPMSPRDDGGPSMVAEIPVEQFRSDFIVWMPTTFSQTFVNVVAPSAMTPRIDGAPMLGSPAVVGASGMSVWSTSISPGQHHIVASDGMTPMGVKVYGVSPYTGYAYPGGMDLQTINPPG
jgi:hypothetical protein